mmetsp:Transcript_18478/g.60462  ORF Transcript_18478/g.60462 Transcript_18478/m.60462 type:complete len:246 (-) Transcript_18478:785-1522(-)
MSGSMCGWQRVTPCPMIMKERVMMLAPSTVMPIGVLIHELPRKLASPRQMPAPPRMSIPSCTTLRPRSVHVCFMMDDSTIGASWLSMMALVSSTPAITAYASRPHRPSASWMPPNSAMGTLNCLRTRAYAPTPATTLRAAPMEPAGSETPRPSAKASIIMCHPKPQRACPPSTEVIGIQTSSPSTVPFMKAQFSGMCRGPIRRPSCPRSSRATVKPCSPEPPSSPDGSCRSKPTPTTPATGARVM